MSEDRVWGLLEQLESWGRKFWKSHRGDKVKICTIPAQILNRQSPGGLEKEQQLEAERTEWKFQLVSTEGKTRGWNLSQVNHLLNKKHSSEEHNRIQIL